MDGRQEMMYVYGGREWMDCRVKPSRLTAAEQTLVKQFSLGEIYRLSESQLYSAEQIKNYGKGYFNMSYVDDVASNAEVIVDDKIFHLYPPAQRQVAQLVGTMEITVLNVIQDNPELSITFEPALKKLRNETLGESPDDYKIIEECHESALQRHRRFWHKKTELGDLGVPFQDLLLHVMFYDKNPADIIKMNWTDSMDLLYFFIHKDWPKIVKEDIPHAWDVMPFGLNEIGMSPGFNY
jgi:hypothetical protein